MKSSHKGRYLLKSLALDRFKLFSIGHLKIHSKVAKLILISSNKDVQIFNKF